MAMSHSRHDDRTDRAPPPDEVRVQLDRILATDAFRTSGRLSDFLRFVVDETLDGRQDRIKQYTIATKVFGRERDFDAQSDPIVRVQAAKLRRCLHRYYSDQGSTDPICIEIPKGTYVPTFLRKDTQPDTLTTGDRLPTVAVMPLTNRTGDDSLDYLVSGFAEDLSTDLSKFEGVSVVSYYTCRQFDIDDVKANKTGHSINADYLITGSIRQFDPELRISVQLSRVGDGRQIWGERFARPHSSDTLFQVQDEVIQAILARVAGAYGEIHKSLGISSRRSEGANLGSYEAILRGLYYELTMDPVDYEAALSALETALQEKPDSPVVAARLAILYLDSYALAFGAVDDAFAKGHSLAERAVVAEPNSADAHYSMAWASLIQRDRNAVEKFSRRMIQLNPGDAYLLGMGGWFLALSGDYQAGLEVIERSRRLNPRSPRQFHFVPFLISFQQGDYEAAFQHACLLDFEGLFWDPLLKASALGHLGRSIEAAAAYQRLRELNPDFENRPSEWIGYLISSDDMVRRLLEGLAAAGLEGASPQH